MDHYFVWNSYSFPIPKKDDAYKYLLDASRGLMAVGREEDRYSIFCDDPENLITDLKKVSIADGYTYGDFLGDLGAAGEVDLQVALVEIDDKTPALNFVTNEQFDTISDCHFYFEDEAYTSSRDVLAVAWTLDACLFSVPTATKWESNNVQFKKYDPDVHLNDNYPLRNISKREHGVDLRVFYDALSAPPLVDLFTACKFTQRFLDWNYSLAPEDETRVRKKMSLAVSRNFQGGTPLFDTLNNADGMREMRFDAFSGGTIRVLFGALPGNRWAILSGFIKKSDKEGYEQEIPPALKHWKELQ